MTLPQFKASLTDDEPPPALSPALRALWYDAQDDWTQAHALVQDEASAEAAWVHAYLHRKEGDAGNAAYWYRLADRHAARGSLADEWALIATTLLDEAS